MKVKRTKTYLPKKEDIKRQWYILDAKDKILGRMAVKIANVLRGKSKPIFTPHLDTGDAVIVINAAELKVSGRKLEQKIYQRYSGYPSGLKEITLQEMMVKKPELVVREAVKNMIPNNKLRQHMLKRLRIYKDDVHSHMGQAPVKLEI